MTVRQQDAAWSPIAPGEHACWLVGAVEDYDAGAGAFVADGVSGGDKVLIVGVAPDRAPAARRAPALVVFDPQARDARDGADASVFEVVRREARAAGREGFRALRVLAQMERIAPAGARFADLVDHELRLEEFAAGSGTSVVCAYRRDAWDAPILRDVSCVHPRELGNGVAAGSFRMSSAGPGRWAVHGAVDFTGAPAFGAAVRAALVRAGRLQVDFDGLDMIDGAGLQALVDAARAVTGGAVTITGANPTVRTLWRLSGFDTPRVPVEMAP